MFSTRVPFFVRRTHNAFLRERHWRLGMVGLLLPGIGANTVAIRRMENGQLRLPSQPGLRGNQETTRPGAPRSVFKTSTAIDASVVKFRAVAARSDRADIASSGIRNAHCAGQTSRLKMNKPAITNSVLVISGVKLNRLKPGTRTLCFGFLGL